MDPTIIAAGISAGSSLLGGIFGSRAQSAAARADREMIERQMALQREFAQNGIRWRVQDAQAAGIHPLYAMGASVPTYSPVSTAFTPNTGFVDGLARMGQDISRAVHSTRTEQERHAAVLEGLQIERAHLENDLLRSQIAKMNHSQVGPAMPSGGPLPSAAAPLDGQGQAFEVVKPEVPATQGPVGNQEAGAFPEVRWARTGSGGMAPMPHNEVIQDADIGNPSAIAWYIRNQILPEWLGGAGPPPKSLLPRGADRWEWNNWRQEWAPVYREWRNGNAVPSSSRRSSSRSFDGSSWIYAP